MKVLAGDIGGTKTILEVFDQTVFAQGRLKRGPYIAEVQQVYASKDYPTFESLVSSFVNEHMIRCDRACFGIAGPVTKHQARTTNLPWIIEAASVQKILGGASVSLLNDVQANAYGVLCLSDSDISVIHPGQEIEEGNIAIISPGTGLGEAGIIWSNSQYQAFASEGGHSTFAPQNALQYELANDLDKQFGHVSWERVLSGPGLVNIYAFLKKKRGLPEPEWLSQEFQRNDPAVVISQTALLNKFPVCVEALELFVQFLGAEAGNWALKLMAVGGVYLGGGIPPKILQAIQSPGFRQAFLDKGRMQSILENIPIKMIMNSRAALLGAGYYASR